MHRLLVLLLALLFACCGVLSDSAASGASTGGGKILLSRHRFRLATACVNQEEDTLLLPDNEEQAAVEATTTTTRDLAVAALANVGWRPVVNFRGILQQGGGDASELLLGLVHPVRLLRSTLLGWAVCEALDHCGLFKKLTKRQAKKKKKKLKGTRYYKRVTTSSKWTTRATKGVIEEPVDPEDFDAQQGRVQRVKPVTTTGTDTFAHLIPESQETSNLLSKSDQEQIVAGYETKPTKKSPRRRPLGKKKAFVLTRKRRFELYCIAGHLLSPLLWLATPIGGWMTVLCAGVEGIEWVDKKFKLELEDNEVMDFVIEPLRSDWLRAVLFGSLVGAITL